MIPINRPWIDNEEKQEIIKVLDENALTSAARDGGKRVQEFESSLRSFLDVKHVIAVNTGTAALHAALLALDIKADDEILLPSFTFVATANSVVASGAKPVFVDINTKDYTIDLQDLKRKISKKSKAILPVHLYGHPSDLYELNEIANQYSLYIIEDACQSLGSIYKNKQTGTFGTMGCFSMYAGKVMTSGEGGAIVTNDDKIADTLKMIRNHGMVEGYDTRILGLNYRLPELSAAIAKIQMKKLKTFLNLRKRNSLLLSNLLETIISKYNIKIPEEDQIKKFNWYLYTLAFNKSDNINLRDYIKKKLIENGIGAAVYYDPPVHKTPFYQRFSMSNNDLQNTNWSSKHVLSLPVHPGVSEMDIQNIVNVLKRELQNIL
ncbi:MAG TPA: DegT/DnrJ/EryC1/StrS family aminotransferase [Nitrososphaeraceae archaeon]|nr:DegT/DnrJ/EryC1/StrS family aminotransferase [Nitrososphaeraceae archaeon]